MPAMPRRSLRWRDFGLTLEVPERVGRVMRRFVPRRSMETHSQLLVQPPPPITVDSREHSLAVARELAATARQYDDIGTDGESSEDEISAHPWYHTIELPGGTLTPGRWDHRPLVRHLGLPEDLRGKRVLDVGSGDGFWAFEFERRGADVTSLDIETFADVDLPPPLHDLFENQRVDLSFRRGLKIARRRLSSQVKLINGSVYDLSVDRVGTFDLVHTGDILLHLRDPALAFQRLREVTSGEARVSDCFDPALDMLGAGACLTRYRGGWDDATWWGPALTTLVQMMSDAGFADVHVLTTYNLADRVSEIGAWRAVLRGHV
jgi:tRNA (mo5U34)-methyltransferase